MHDKQQRKQQDNNNTRSREQTIKPQNRKTSTPKQHETKPIHRRQ